MSEKNSQTLIYPKWTQLSYEHRRQVILDTKTLHCRYVEENFNCPDGFAKDDLAEEIYDIAAEKGVPITKAALKKHVLTELTMLNRLETRRRNKGDRQCKAESVVRVP